MLQIKIGNQNQLEKGISKRGYIISNQTKNRRERIKLSQLRIGPKAFVNRGKLVD